MIQRSNICEGFPVIFGRQGGGKLDILNKLESATLSEQFQLLRNLDIRIKDQKKDLLEVLYREINLDQDNTFLINLKRNIFNDRSLSKYLTHKNIKSTLRQTLEVYDFSISLFNESFSLFEAQFQKSLLSSVSKLKEVSNLNFLQNGLLFSSHVLYEQIKKSTFQFESLNKKNTKLVVSTLKYITRSITKTTPLSSFNTLFYLTNTKDGYISKKANSQFFIQLHNIIFYYLKDELLSIYEFRKKLPVVINSTLWEEENKLHFFVNKKNNETFKKLEVSEILEFIINEVKSNSFSFEELINLLIKITSKENELIVEYLEKLISEGFLKLHFPVSHQNNKWYVELQEYIQRYSFKDEKITAISELLTFLSINTEKVKSSRVIDDKKYLISNSYWEIVRFFKSINPSIELTQKINAQSIYYEDVLKQIDFKIPSDTFQKIENLLKSAYVDLNLFSYKRDYKFLFRDVLLGRYEGKISLLKFYEEIYLKNLPPEYNLNSSTLNLCQQFLQKIREHKEDDIIDLSAYLSTKNDKPSNSFGAYIQSVDSNFSTIILNSFSKGHGANSSRFFNLCPDEKVKSIKKHNTNDRILISDIRDASIHNSNTYPSLTDHTIHLSEPNKCANNGQLSLSNLFVIADKEKGIKIINDSNLEVLPIQFSLEGLNRKSKFCQFLDIFDSHDVFGLNYLKHQIRELFEYDLKEVSVVRIPRIVYKKKLVIERQRWLVKKDTLRSVILINSFATLFYEINKWRTENNIPDKVFVRAKAASYEKKEGLQYKPQYIDFTIPIFTLLIKNLLKNTDEIIEFSEVLPSVNDVKQNGGYVQEFLFNIKN